MLRKFDIVLWYNYIKPLLRMFDLNEVKNFNIIFVNIVCQSKW